MSTAMAGKWSMGKAYIVAAVRTAGGSRNGKLAGWHPAEPGPVKYSMRCSTARGIDPRAIEDVILGCVSQVGEQSFHIGRNAALASASCWKTSQRQWRRHCARTSARCDRRQTHGNADPCLARVANVYGLQTMYEGGGFANVTIVEALVMTSRVQGVTSAITRSAFKATRRERFRIEPDWSHSSES
jgi:hypothetical protein